MSAFGLKTIPKSKQFNLTIATMSDKQKETP
jgi:hypothetical protein